ncbi:hypothetical protein LBMAG46_38380 [Planctomycetia bacterium]|nr:hypothetical protein LBMAG46_38380 [Planctomycetia bacterium]
MRQPKSAPPRQLKTKNWQLTANPPLAPNGGEGSGVRGQEYPNTTLCLHNSQCLPAAEHRNSASESCRRFFEHEHEHEQEHEHEHEYEYEYEHNRCRRF